MSDLGLILDLQRAEKRITALVDVLREARCWIPDGTGRSPEQKGAKVDTLGSVFANIDSVLSAVEES